MTKQINLDAEYPRYTPFFLMEYSSAMADDSGVCVVESKDAKTASVNIACKTITISAVDYSRPMTRDRYKITKGFIDHEIAPFSIPTSPTSGKRSPPARGS